jgi:translation initiation factor 2B subunit (eIF-2B alpha/beta/delta family)
MEGCNNNSRSERNSYDGKNDMGSSLSPTLKKQLQKLSNDSIHGSTFITKKAIELIKKYVSTSMRNDGFSIIILQKILTKIVRSQPSMALLLNFSNNLLYFIDSLAKEEIADEDKINHIIHFIVTFEKSLNQAEKTISRLTTDELRSVSPIATYSSSKTVQNAIESIAKKQKSVQIYCAESRPKNEGAKLARHLSKKEIEVFLMTDATLFSLISKVKAVIIGADAITNQGIINKIGSKPLVQLANKKDVKVYCICSTHKIMPFEYSLQKESEKPSTDILDETNNDVNVINYYFDMTPHELFTGIITENGIIDKTKINQYTRNKNVHPLLLDFYK